MNVVQRVLGLSLFKLTRVACCLALVGLAMMAYSIVDPRAVPVIGAMSVGHAFGIGAFGCYLLAVVLDIRRGEVADSTTVRRSGASQNSESEQGRSL